MKTLYLVANWKSNLTRTETSQWLDSFKTHKDEISQHTEKKVIVCPAYLSLPAAKLVVHDLQLPILLGVQDVSPFPPGAYTGEVHAGQVKEFADYVIIGHSERRQHFGETDELLTKKVAMAMSEGLTPIFCVQGKETAIPDGVTLVAYEPVWAIGSGHADTPESANEVARTIKEAHSAVTVVLYGGSVKPENVATFTAMEDIDGVLVGGASLDSETFAQLIHNT